MQAGIDQEVTSNYQRVQTYIQSGNIVLQSRVKPDNINTLVKERFSIDPVVFVLDSAEFDAAAENNPFRSPNGKDIHLYFCKDHPSPDTAKMERYLSDSEEYHIHGKIFYLYAPDGIGRSRLVANMESCLGVATTGRNLNTIHKLQQMVQHV